MSRDRPIETLMDANEKNILQLKANKPHKGGHVYCPGFTDKNGMWNNGFTCPRWGSLTENYCCGSADDRYCCPEVEIHSTLSTEPENQLEDARSITPIIVGACVGVTVILSVILVACFFCFYQKKRKRSSQLQKAPDGTNTSVSDMETASTVRSSQLFSQTSSQPRRGPSHESLHLHCGCSQASGTFRTGMGNSLTRQKYIPDPDSCLQPFLYRDMEPTCDFNLYESPMEMELFETTSKPYMQTFLHSSRPTYSSGNNYRYFLDNHPTRLQLRPQDGLDPADPSRRDSGVLVEEQETDISEAATIQKPSFVALNLPNHEQAIVVRPGVKTDYSNSFY